VPISVTCVPRLELDGARPSVPPRRSADLTAHTTNSAQFKVNTSDHGIEDFDILMVCDYGQASIFQATNVNSSNVTIVHNTGNVSSGPGNCTKGLGLLVECTTKGTVKEYGPK